MPIFVVVAIALSVYGTLILAVVKKTLPITEFREKGFSRRTVLMISTLVGFAVMCVVIVANYSFDVNLVRVIFFAFCAFLVQKVTSSSL